MSRWTSPSAEIAEQAVDDAPLGAAAPARRRRAGCSSSRTARRRAGSRAAGSAPARRRRSPAPSDSRPHRQDRRRGRDIEASARWRSRISTRRRNWRDLGVIVEGEGGHDAEVLDPPEPEQHQIDQRADEEEREEDRPARRRRPLDEVESRPPRLPARLARAALTRRSRRAAGRCRRAAGAEKHIGVGDSANAGRASAPARPASRRTAPAGSSGGRRRRAPRDNRSSASRRIRGRSGWRDMCCRGRPCRSPADLAGLDHEGHRSPADRSVSRRRRRLRHAQRAAAAFDDDFAALAAGDRRLRSDCSCRRTGHEARRGRV